MTAGPTDTIERGKPSGQLNSRGPAPSAVGEAPPKRPAGTTKAIVPPNA